MTKMKNQNQMRTRKYGTPESPEYVIFIYTYLYQKYPQCTHQINFTTKDEMLNFLDQHKKAREFFKNQTSSVNLTKYEPYSLRWLVTHKYEIHIIKNHTEYRPTLNHPKPHTQKTFRSVLLENIETQNETR